MFSNLKFAFRSLRKSPGFTAIVVLTLALGIGANTAIFSVFNEFLLRSLPVPHPEELVNLSAPGPKAGRNSAGIAGNQADVFSYPMFRDLERIQTVFTGIAAHQPFRVNLAHKGQVRDGGGMLVSGSYFSVLQARPALGRLLNASDDAKVGGAQVAVLSYDYWQSRFAGNPSLLNEVITLNGQPFTIVGIAPRGFDSTVAGFKPQVFVPITLKGLVDPRGLNGNGGFDNRLGYWVNLFARLKPGVSIEQAGAQLNVHYRAILNEVEAPLQPALTAQTMAQFRAKEISLSAGAQGRSMLTSNMDKPLTLLLGVTCLVLLIACANIANLLLARGAARHSEIAVRLSLGATRWQIVRQLLAETLVLALCGGLAAIVCAYWILSFVQMLVPGIASGMVSAKIDGTALSFTLALTVGAALLSGLLPALRSVRTDLLPSIKGHSVGPAGGRATARVTATLIASQTIMAMLLLVSAGLLLKSLSNIAHVDLGFKTESLVTFRVSPDLNAYSPERSLAFFQRLEAELAAIPGATHVTASLVPLLGHGSWSSSVVVQGFINTPDTPADASFNSIGVDYFRTLGIPLIAGREFNLGDDAGAPKVAIVNEEFTRRFNLGANAVGKWMAPGGEGDALDVQIVGVVKDSKYDNIKDKTPPQFFMPYRQNKFLGAMSLYIHAALPPEQILLQASKIVTRLDPGLPVEDAKTLARQIDESVFADRLIGSLCVGFALLAILLAAVGLYGMLSYSVAQRTKEIGVRMALGARPAMVAWPILRSALRLAAIGIGVGGLASLAFAGLMRHLLFGVEPNDPIAIVIAGSLLLAIAGIAAWLPAWRASKVDPLVALRTE